MSEEGLEERLLIRIEHLERQLIHVVEMVCGQSYKTEDSVEAIKAKYEDMKEVDEVDLEEQLTEAFEAKVKRNQE